MPKETFHCVRCGKCCQSFFIPVSREDVFRWSIQFRSDILDKITAEDMAFQPVMTESGMQCPFLEISGNDAVSRCGIHSTKPHACRTFPVSVRQAQAIDCPGAVS